MLRTIHLYGRLSREFGAAIRLDVASAAEAARALEANFPGRFYRAIRDGAFKLVRGDRHHGLVLGEEELRFQLGSADLHVIPVPKGHGKGKGGAKVVVGLAIMAVAVVASGGAAAVAAGQGLAGFSAAMGSGFLSWGTLGMVGLTMTLSGVSQLLSPTPKMADSFEAVDKRPSFLFNGPVNAQEQGGPLALIYGRVRVGSTVGSAGMAVEQVQSTQPAPGTPGGGTSVVGEGPAVTAPTPVPFGGYTGDGLVITARVAETTHFHIGDVAGCELYFKDGRMTRVRPGSYITAAEAEAGLIALQAAASASFTVASARAVGLGSFNLISGTTTVTMSAAGLVGGSGGGGGKGGGGSGRVAQEDPNTLQSKTTARVVDLLGEGEIVGLVDGARSIYFDGTPLLASDGTFNFKGVAWTFRHGLPDQPHVEGFAAAESETAVTTEVKADAPVVRTISDANADAARVTVRVPVLTEQNTSNGDLKGARVQIAIDVRPAGGGWTEVVNDVIEGKTTSAYERAYWVGLPSGGQPWDLRVRRLTPDSAQTALQNQTWWQSFTAIVEGKFSYPDTAYIALTVDAQQFGNTIPARAYEVKGLKIRVPTVYDPETRAYANGGVWDGTFKTAWTDNPAWVLYDLLTNERYGLGEFIDLTQADKWRLYQIARYCDQPVPDGLGGSEPRYTFNGVIQTREDAYKVIQSIASAFRGLTFWSSGQVFARADMPEDPVKIVAPANVVGGRFTYAGTSLKARHTVAKVAWNDPDDGYKATIEPVEHPEGLRRYGERSVDVTAFGCTKRSLARRLGLWLLDTEQSETETVTYEVSFDHADVVPGDIVEIHDPAYVGGDALADGDGRYGGRLKTAAGAGVTLDAPVELRPGQGYTLSVVLPDGRIEDRAVVTGAGRHTALTLAAPFSQAPAPGTMWGVTGSDIAPRPFRVRTIREKSANVYEITALFHDATKYARIEQGVHLEPPPFQIGGTGVPQPRDLRAVESVYWVNGLPHSRISVSWTPPPSPQVVGFEARIFTPGGQWQTWAVTRQNGFDIEPAAEGRYLIRVVSVTNDGRRSLPAEIAIIANGKGTPPGKPTSLTALGGIRQVALSWINPPDSDLKVIEVFENKTDDLATARKVGEAAGTTYIRTGLDGYEERYYWVRAVDLGGNEGDFNSNLGTWAQTQVIDVNDIGEELLEKFYEDLPQRIPLIDFSFLNAQVENVIGDGPLGQALLETIRQGYDRFEEIKTERGVTNAKFAAVETSLTELVEENQALAEQITTVGAAFETNMALVEERLTTLADADQALAERVTLVDARVAENAAALLAESRARVDAVQAVATQTTLLRTDFEGNRAAVAQELRALSTADQATASRIDTLAARVGNAESAIATETTARVGADGSLAQQITQARAHTDSAIAGYDAQIKVWVNNSSALASSVATLQSTVNGHTSAIQTHQQVINGLSARWGVTIDNNGYVVGVALVNDGVRRNAFIASVDNFFVALPGYGHKVPFAIAPVNGVPTVAITRAMIGDASIDAAAIGFAQIDRAHIRDLTINGQKIEDFATGNMAYVSFGSEFQGNTSATLHIWTVGNKPVAFIIHYGPARQGATENGINYSMPSTVIQMHYPGPGIYSVPFGAHFGTCTVLAIELRK
ncbi:hypothetical protein [Azospirillum argentinense]|uniref:TipJ family phage tail tip protein n=1 Tax=Azospirillum argentinense TaxID=2970906 RepID=UPI0032DE9133